MEDITPKFKLGKARVKLQGQYMVLATRLNVFDRSRLSALVEKYPDVYNNQEDFLEDAAYKFYVNRPYVKGAMFLFPHTPFTCARSTEEIRRTGWYQINFTVNNNLGRAIKDTVQHLRRYNGNISLSVYLYTALRWHMDRLERYNPLDKVVEAQDTPAVKAVPTEKAKKTGKAQNSKPKKQAKVH